MEPPWEEQPCLPTLPCSCCWELKYVSPSQRMNTAPFIYDSEKLEGKNVALRKAQAINCSRPLCRVCSSLADAAGGSGITSSLSGGSRGSAAMPCLRWGPRPFRQQVLLFPLSSSLPTSSPSTVAPPALPAAVSVYPIDSLLRPC